MKIQHYKKTTLCLVLMLMCTLIFIKGSFAQDRLSGRIFEDKTKIALAGIAIENPRSHNVTVSDTGGRFSIKANIGDIIIFSGFPYQADTLYVQNLKYTEINLLLRQNNLKEVRVTASEINTGSLKSTPVVSPFGGHTVLYQTDAKLQNTGGIKFMIGDYHANANRKKKEDLLSANEAASAKIVSVFNPKNLQNYLPIKGQEMDNFIILYMPDIKTYTNNFDLIQYLDVCYKEFLKIPIEQRQSKSYLDLNAKPDQ